jgi:hypothetical protein
VNHKYIKNLSVLLALVLMLGSVFAVLPNMVRAEEQILVETFDNYKDNNTGYSSGNFVGNHGITWNYEGARGNLMDSGVDYAIDGNGMILRRSGANSKVYATINGGIKDFSVDLKKAMTNNNKREVE